LSIIVLRIYSSLSPAMAQCIQIICKHKYLLLLCFIASSLYYNLFIDRAYVGIRIQVEKETYLKLYLAEHGKQYLERESIYIRVYPEKEKYGFYATDIENIEKIRLDPIEYAGQCTIKKISFKQNGLQPIVLKEEADFSRLQPLNEIVDQKFNENGFTFTSGGKDPFFELRPEIKKGSFIWAEELIRLVFICGVVALIYYSTHHLFENYQFVPLFLASIFIMVTVMAVISKRNSHPDEYVHLQAAQYYTDHWLPPVIEDPDIRNTYSGYGASRLNTYEVYYFIGGKLKNIISLFHLPGYLSFRLINVLFFSIILISTIKIPQTRVLAVPLLISPQIWYIFSYANGDALGLLLSFIAGSQVLIPDSMLNSYLQRNDSSSNVIRLIFLAVLLTLLLLLKKNYLFFVAFLFFCLVLKIYRETDSNCRRKMIKRLIALSMISFSLVGLRFGADYYVNGFDRAAKLKQVEEKFAYYEYNPTTELKDQHALLFLKERGYSLKYVAFDAHWLEKTFRSFFGVYGYLSISAPANYYQLVRHVAILFFTFFFFSIVLRAGILNNLLFGSLLFLTALMIGSSLIHSWISDFQPQGRYLMPFIPMIGLLFGLLKRYIHTYFNTIFVSILFIVSVYSFIYIGLFNIPKTVF